MNFIHDSDQILLGFYVNADQNSELILGAI